MARVTDAEKHLASLIARFNEEIADLADAILGEMRKFYPTAIELVYDNYNALAIGYSPTERPSEAIFSVALYPKWVSLFFLQAAGLPDPDKLLRGSGSVAKHIVLPSADMLHFPAVRALMREAEARAKAPFNPKGAHQLIIKSISEKQRPRRPGAEGASQPTPPKPHSGRKKASPSTRLE